MPRYRRNGKRPDFDGLLRLASTRGGLFSLCQAQDYGVSRQLLAYYLRTGKIERVERGIYRSTLFPRSNHEDVLTRLLIAGREAVAAGPTALEIWNVGNLESSKVYIKLPTGTRTPHLPHGTEVMYGPTQAVVYDSVPVEPVPSAITSTFSINIYDQDQLGEVVRDAREHGLIEEDLVPESDTAHPAKTKVNIGR